MATTSRQVISSGRDRSVSRTAMRVASARPERARSSPPQIQTVPATAASWRASVFRRVDFPEPFGPISATISPRRTSKPMPWISALPS